MKTRESLAPCSHPRPQSASAGRNHNSNLLFYAVVCTILWLVETVRAAGPIGVRFEGDTSTSLAATDQAGAPGYVQTNWNNEIGATGTGVTVVDNDGAATGLTVSWTANNIWGDGNSVNTPDGKLMSHYLDSTGTVNDNSASYQFTINANRPEVYVEGLTAWMAARGAASYDVVVYYDGDSNSGRIGEYWLQKSAGKGVNGLPNALGPDLSTHVFLSDNDNFGGTYNQVPSSANSIVNAAGGNYIVFSGAASDNFILRTEERFNRAGITAIQIVPNATVVAPVIGTQPAGQTKFVGGNVTFSVSTGGTSPQYQWVKVGTGNLSNQTNNTLTLNTLSLTDNGSQFYVVVSNSSGTIQSDTVTLTVLSVPHDNGFVSGVLSNAPLAYWRFNESSGPTISDYIGSRTGVAGANTSSSGDLGLNPNGQFLGFETGNTGWFFQNGGTDPAVVAPGLNLKTNTATFVAWLDPQGGSSGQAQWAGVIMNRSDNSGITYTDTKNELGYIWNGYYSFHSGLIVPDGQWSMVAMVVQPTQVTLYMVNPTSGLVSSSSVRATAPANWGGETTIGTDPQFTSTRGFSGGIDEVAVFTNSLTSSQILSLYAAGRAAGSLPPVIGQQPASETIYAGRPARLTVAASGSGTLTYQWKKNNTAITNGPGISGAQTATLVISNMAAGNVGSYSVDVSNPAGTTPSSAATLGIVSPTGQPYETAVLAANPYAYWRLNESAGPTAFDYVGGFSGTYGSTATPAAAGPQPPDFPGFESTNTAVMTARNVSGSYVAAPPLNLNTNRVTITAWVYSTGGQDGAAGMVYCRGSGNSSGLCYQGGSQLSYTWNDNWNWNSGLNMPDGQWVFVAMVIEPTKGTLYMGTNGALQSATLTANNAVQSFNTTTYIGGDVAFGDSRIFNGTVDEVAIFNRSLSSDEIANLYSQATGTAVPPQVTILTPSLVSGYPGFTTTFTASAIGSGPLSYQWYKGTNAVNNDSRISGATNLSLAISNTKVSDSGDYTLVVTNTAGSTTSSVSTLDIGPVPGTPYSTTVMAANPVAYWRLNETTGTTAHDSVGGHDGTYGSAMQLGAAGQENAGMFGFGADTAAPVFAQNTAQSWVTVPPLNLNTNRVTIMAWVFPTMRPPNWSGIFIPSSPSRGGMMFRDNTPNTLGLMWNNGDFWYDGTSLNIPVNQWSLVALSVEPTDATLYVMNNSGTNSWALTNTMNAMSFNTSALIGDDNGDTGRVFNGSINEVAVFNRTLTASELGQFFSAAATTQLAPPTLQIGNNGGNLQVTWTASALLLESTNILGPWITNTGATSPFTATNNAPQKFFRLLTQ